MNYPFPSRQAWQDHIFRLRSQEKMLNLSHKEIIRRLASLVEKTIITSAKEALKKGKLGVLFSGGVDSTLICFVLHKHNIAFHAICVGFQDNEEQKFPDDVLQARAIAKEYGFSYSEVLLDFIQTEELLHKTAHMLESKLNNVVNVGVGSVEVAGIQGLKKIDAHIDQVFGGLGSEEIFAGYKRHADASNIHEECWRGLSDMYERDLLRDIAIARALDITFHTPFLQDELISFSMNIPDMYKQSPLGAKLILREAAMNLGLSEKWSLRPKKAAQYGSRTDRAIAKLAKQKGFKYKKDFLGSLLEK